MTDKIMELADAYAAADAEEHHEMEFGNQYWLKAAIYKNQQARAALEAAIKAAIKAEQDYTAAVISERDAFCTEADVLRMALTAMQSERDKLTMVHAERTVERDRLRKVAQMAYQALGYAMGCIENMTDIEEMKMQPVLEALRKELGQ